MNIDYARLFRFCVIGFLVAVVYVSLYTLLYRVGVDPFTANSLAYILAVIVQYVGQTVWTFRRQLWDGQQSVRFFTVIGLGLVYSSLVAGDLGPSLGWRPWVSAGLVAVTLPVLNYISFRLWVYRAKPAEESQP